MPTVTRKVTRGADFHGEGGYEVDVTYEMPVLASFEPVADITVWEMAQVIRILTGGSDRVTAFTDEEWEDLGDDLRRHWSAYGVRSNT